MESNEKPKTTSEDCWRHEYVLIKQLQKTDDSNLKQMNKVVEQKHLKITLANQRLDIQDKKLTQNVKELNCKKRNF